MPVGTYEVSAASKGFQSQKRSDLQLNVASALAINYTLPTGQLNESVRVEGRTGVPHPDAANGQLMGSRSIVELPSNGRDYGRFALLTPGGVQVQNQVAENTFNGLDTVDNTFSIDGVDATRVDEPYMANGQERGPRLLTGSLATIEEFRV
jgi:hypothetical protein